MILNRDGSLGSQPRRKILSKLGKHEHSEEEIESSQNMNIPQSGQKITNSELTPYLKPKNKWCLIQE